MIFILKLIGKTFIPLPYFFIFIFKLLFKHIGTITKMKKKINLSIDCEEVYEMEASMYSEIGKDGLRFLR